jgi:anti-anti-sigma factor
MSSAERQNSVEPGELTISPSRAGEEYVIGVAGELDLATCHLLREGIVSALGSDARKIVLDLRDLTFMDSTGLRAVLAAEREARDQNKELAIIRGPRAVQRVFELTSLDSKLPFVD